MDVSEIGEFGLIERLLASSPFKRGDIVVGPGDDAAVWKVGRTKPTYVVFTTDTLVEGVHFRADVVPWTDVGFKALAVNASDVFAMGGEPQFALVTLGVQHDMEVASLDAVYQGIRECGFGVSVIGGDIVRSGQFFITVALIGKAQERNGAPLLLRRDHAVVGDAIAVTGTLGDSAAGLRKLLRGDGDLADPLIRAHLRPRPPGFAGIIAARMRVECGIDVSDGLLQDVGHLCEMSETGAVLHAAAVPISEDLRAAFPAEALELACTGGEDYQLVLTGPADLLREVERLADVPLSIIGEIVEDAGRRVRLLDADGREVDFEAAGWDHLRAAPSKRRT